MRRARAIRDMQERTEAALWWREAVVDDVTDDLWVLLTKSAPPGLSGQRRDEWEVLRGTVAQQWVAGGHRQALMLRCVNRWLPGIIALERGKLTQ